jgi:hypothetical protein
MFVAAHLGRLECRACSVRTAKALAGSLDAARCDLCREVRELEPCAFHAGSTLLVTAGAALGAGRRCTGRRRELRAGDLPGHDAAGDVDEEVATGAGDCVQGATGLALGFLGGRVGDSGLECGEETICGHVR